MARRDEERSPNVARQARERQLEIDDFPRESQELVGLVRDDRRQRGRRGSLVALHATISGEVLEEPVGERDDDARRIHARECVAGDRRVGRERSRCGLLGASFVRVGRTAPGYRLYDLPGASPPKPGLLRVNEEGAAIELELWRLDHAAFGRLVASVPAPLTIGDVRLGDGSLAKGYLVEAAAVEGAPDISAYGGWRGYRAAAG